MPPIEIGPGGPQAIRPARAVEPRSERGPIASDSARAHASSQSAVVRSAAIDPGAPPVDSDRVAQIRKAIEQGSYPIIPTRVADAMIAAGLLLRSGK